MYDFQVKNMFLVNLRDFLNFRLPFVLSVTNVFGALRDEQIILL